MPRVELVYDADCPNVEAAREQLRRALAQAGQATQWEEWERSDPAAPAYARRYGSPTILVDGRDVAGGPPTDANCCRLYRTGEGRLQGIPSVKAIASALCEATARGGSFLGSGDLAAWLALIPACAAAIVPNLGCPVCWPAYAGFLSALGLGFLVPLLMQTRYLLALNLVSLLAVMAALGFGARRRRGYGPLLAGLGGAGLVIVGKFVLGEWDPMVLAGFAVLVAALVWNSWPRRIASPTCPSCVTTGSSSPD